MLTTTNKNRSRESTGVRRLGAATLAMILAMTLTMTLSLGLVVLSSASAEPPASSAAVEAGEGPGKDAGSDKAPTAPTIACAERLAITIQSYYDAVDDFAASFQQQTRSVTLGNASLGADAPSSGTVQFAKPGKMKDSVDLRRWNARGTAPARHGRLSDRSGTRVPAGRRKHSRGVQRRGGVV